MRAPTAGAEEGCHNLFGVARLKDGVSFATAFADIKTIAANLERQYPEINRDQKAFMMTLTDVIVGDVRPILLVLLAGAALLLLIAAVNVASLLLVRSERRKREMAVRGALGASRIRLIRLFVTEGVLLAVSAGVLGAAVASVVMRLFLRLIPKDMLATMPYLQEIGLSPRVLTFAALVALTTGVLFSLLPALRISLYDLREGLSEGSRGSSGTVWRRFGANLVVVELSMAVVLLVGAGLLGKSSTVCSTSTPALSRTISPPCKSQPSAIPIRRTCNRSIFNASSGRGFRAFPASTPSLSPAVCRWAMAMARPLPHCRPPVPRRAQ